MKQIYINPRQMLDGVDVFVLVAERRNFTAAARVLGISPSAVSQQIQALEARVGVPLLVRTTRNVGLTEAGETFYRRAAPVVSEISAAYDETRNLREPSGILRLSIPALIIDRLIEPIMADFCAAYPKIDLDIVSSDRPVNLITEGFDAGVTIGELLDKDTVGFRLSNPVRFALVGTPSYFERYGRPQSIYDLRQHSCIRRSSQNEDGSQWHLLENGRQVSVNVSGRIASTNIALCLSAARKGLGLLIVPEQLVTDDLASGCLESVLTEHLPTSDGLFLHYPNRANIMPKLRVFIDHVAKHIKHWTDSHLES